MTEKTAAVILTQIYNTWSTKISENYKDGVVRDAFELALAALSGSSDERSGTAFIHFGRRMAIEKQYLKWCEQNSVAEKPNSMVAFLLIKGWLNEEKIAEELRPGGETHDKHTDTHACDCAWQEVKE